VGSILVQGNRWDLLRISAPEIAVLSEPMCDLVLFLYLSCCYVTLRRGARCCSDRVGVKVEVMFGSIALQYLVWFAVCVPLVE
jgi:hypothetical protein